MITLLLVDDAALNRQMIKQWLLKWGYTVIEASDGQEAVTRAQAECPALILMDLNMPVLDGWEATQQLKQNPDTRSIPIIALTALDSAEARNRAHLAGCDEFVTKPIDFNGLRDIIQHQLDSGA